MLQSLVLKKEHICIDVYTGIAGESMLQSLVT